MLFRSVGTEQHTTAWLTAQATQPELLAFKHLNGGCQVPIACYACLKASNSGCVAWSVSQAVVCCSVPTARAPQRFRYAQLCDVAGPRPEDMDEILRQARHERRFPGDGDCDLHGLLNALPAGIPLSLEIPTQQLLEQGVSALDRATWALEKARQVLQSR